MEWRIGDVVADLYEVRQVLGRGGMGVVHRVRHRGWDIDLAVKSPLPALVGSAGDRALFVAEAEAWVSLGLHPHICACHYVRAVDGLPRVFAEYVGGGSLSEHIRGGGLYRGDPRDVLAGILDLTVQIAWGLEHAHSRGLVHQDVKPANVLLDADGTAKVTDFGLAKAVREGPVPGSGTVTTAGMTPAYASPEQSGGRRVDRTSDVYSLAVAVLEMFTGGVTWRSGVAAGAALRAELEQPSLLPVPPDLAGLLLRCLDHDPARRPADMTEIAGACIAVWRRLTGREYTRRRPVEAELTADELNNRALSHTDLGRHAAAAEDYAAALRADPRHPAATYNAGLLRWRTGVTTDVPLVDALEAIRAEEGDPPAVRELLGQVHLERGDLEAAAACGAGIPAGLPDARMLTEARLPWARPPRSNRDLPALAVAHDSTGRSVLSVDGNAEPVMRHWIDDELVRVFTADTGRLVSVAQDQAGRIGAAGAADGTVRLWDLTTGAALGVLSGHTRDVLTLAIGPAGDTLLSAGYDRTVRVWSLPGGACLRVIPHPEWIQCVAMSADGLVLSGAADGFRLWRGDDLLHHWPAPSGRPSRAAAFTSGGRYAVGADTTATRMWRVEDGTLVRTFPGAAEAVRVSTDGRFVLVGGSDARVRHWDFVAGRCVRTFHAGGLVAGVWVAPDGRTARSAAVTGAHRSWRLPGPYTAPAKVSRPRSHRTLTATSEAFESLLTAGLVRQARALPGFERDPRGLTAWRRLAPGRARTGLRAAWTTRTLTGHTAYIIAAAASRTHTITGSADRTARLRDDTGGVRVLEGHDGKVEAVALAGDIALTGSGDRTLRLWSVTTGECLQVVDGFRHGVRSIAVAPAGDVAVIGTAFRTLMLFDIARGAVVAELEGHTDAVQSVSFSADGTRAITGGYDKTVRLWSIPSGEQLTVHRGHDKAVGSVALGQGFALSAGHDRTIRRWDLTTGECTLRFDPAHSSVNAVRLTADGRHAVTAGTDAAVRIWSAADGTVLHTLPGHTEGVQDVSLFDDDWQAISAGFDAQARIWHLDWDLESVS